jgi:chromosome segregation ATPase
MSDRNLEEAIFRLQKLNTENGVKQLVEEAAQLVSKGRNMEAGALLEKAEAIVAQSGAPPTANRHGSAPVGHADQSKAAERIKVDEPTRVDEQAIVNMAGKLADGLSKILTGTFQELERHVIGESQKISTSLEQQLHRLQATIDSLVQLRVKFEQLTEAVSEQQVANAAIAQRQDQTSDKVTALEQNVSRHETELGTLRGETTTLTAEAAALRTDTGLLRTEAKEFSTVTVQQIEGLAARLGLHQEELTSLQSNVSEISRKVTGILERLDRQAEVIRSLRETQTRRTEALDELLGILTRLKAPVETMMAAAAGQL